VLGTSESIKALTAGGMRGYFEHRYSPDNITLAAAGKIDFDQLVADATKIIGHWRPTGAKRIYVDPTCSPGEKALSDKKLNRHYLAMMAPAPSAQDPRRYAARILADVLGDSEGSRLYWALIDPGLAEEADFSFGPQDQSGMFIATACCDPARATQVEAIIHKTIDGLAGTVERGEVERAQNKIATHATLQGENPGGRMRSLGVQWTYLGEYTPLATELERIMAVTVADVEALIAAYKFRPWTIVRLGPG
jgi:predicted Zn-dependent peptidase